MQGIIADVGELLASALTLLLVELEEVRLTHVNPCGIMAKLLGRYSLQSGLFDEYTFKDA